MTTSTGVLSQLLADLAAEGAELDQSVAALEAGQWTLPTPAPGWTIAHQIAHLAWTDDQARLAATDPDAFAAQQRRLAPASAETGHAVDLAAAEGARQPPEELLDRWRAGRAALDEALLALPPGARIPWYGTAMAAPSMATARIMETWAHGGDVADALGVHRVPTDRLRHVAHLGVRTRDFSFAVHGLVPPREEFRIELRAPSGDTWTWGPVEASDRLTGDGADFAALVTQRLNRADADLSTDSPEVERWLGLAQAFAGPPGPGRPPR